nr:hypothetical protein GCM10020093_061370 [Planobispora longispora]
METAAVRAPWRPIIPLCLAMAFLYVGDAAVSNYSTVYMEGALRATGWLVPFAYLVYQAAMLLARIPGDFAVRRYGPAPVVRLGAVVAALGTLGVVVAPGPFVAVAAFGLVGIGLSIIAPQSFSAAGRLGAGAETAIARVNLFNYVGFVVGAAVVGTVNDLVNVRVAFIPAAVVVALIVFLAGASGPGPPRPRRVRGSGHRERHRAGRRSSAPARPPYRRLSGHRRSGDSRSPHGAGCHR